jgi:hypothetical protein
VSPPKENRFSVEVPQTFPCPDIESRHKMVALGPPFLRTVFDALKRSGAKKSAIFGPKSAIFDGLGR